MGLLVLLGLALGSPVSSGAQNATQGKPEPKVDGVYIKMQSDGLPGNPKLDGEETRTSRQELVVTADRLRLLDAETGITYLFRLDLEPARIWELSQDMSEYRDAKKHEEIQHARDRWERQTLQREKRNLPEDEFQRFLNDNHLREDGTREIRMQVDEDAGTRLDYAVKRYRVYENDRLIVDALVTEDLRITIPFFDYYRKVGAFSNEVLTELQKIEGVPLEAKFTVITDVFNHEISVVVTDAARRQISLGDFELPPDSREARPEAAIVACVRMGCSNLVEREAPADRYTYRLRTFLFCSKACKSGWYEKELIPDLKKHRGKASPPK